MTVWNKVAVVLTGILLLAFRARFGSSIWRKMGKLFLLLVGTVLILSICATALFVLVALLDADGRRNLAVYLVILFLIGGWKIMPDIIGEKRWRSVKSFLKG